MSLVAYMLGARVIEKHFTLSHAAKGTDHAYSLDAGGDAEARPRPAPCAGGARRRRQAAAADGAEAAREDGQEAGGCARANRRSRPLRPGHRDQVAYDGGLPPYELDNLVGRRLARALATDETVDFDVSRAGRRARGGRGETA